MDKNIISNSIIHKKIVPNFTIITIFIAPLTYLLIFYAFHYLEAKQAEKDYISYMTKPLETKIEYINLKKLKKHQNSNEKITRIMNRYKEAGYDISINNNTMIAEKRRENKDDY